MLIQEISFFSLTVFDVVLQPAVLSFPSYMKLHMNKSEGKLIR